MALAHGSALAGKSGGDQRSYETDARIDGIMAMLDENGDVTLAENPTQLAERGITVGSAHCGDSDRHKAERKKPVTQSGKPPARHAA